MSNQIHFQPTQFTNVRTGGVSFGYRAYDDYGQAYDNTWESIPDDDLEFLRQVIAGSNEAVGAMLEFAEENEKGVFVGDTFIDWETLQPLLTPPHTTVGPAPGVITREKVGADLAIPAQLTPLGRQACEKIIAYLNSRRLTATNGCHTFYSPEEWRERGELYGRDSLLIVVYEGSDVREAFDSEHKFDHEEGMRVELSAIGVYPERCTTWYSAIYPL